MVCIQSGEVPVLGEQKDTAVVQQETVQFMDAGEAELDFNESTQFEETYSEHSGEIASLGKYLERPVKISQFIWNETDTFTTVFSSISPWHLYFSNTYIANKLANFSRLHCNLKLTFRFNASPFYYGALRACYDPLVSGKFDNPVSDLDMIPMSQMPGVWMEPHVTSTAEMTLPFLWPSTWLDTTDASSFADLGKLHFMRFVPLRSANGVTGTGITVTVYAQATDIEIAGPTAAAILQSGPISGPANSIARFADSLSGFGAIAPYARAASIGSRAVGAIAKIFGYSNSPVTTDVIPVQNKVFHAFANTETCVPIDKLALDPKNEITVDGRVTGDVADDNLVIRSIVTKPAVLVPAVWDTTMASSQRLWTNQVTPCIRSRTVTSTQDILRYTPSGFVAENFRFWRGGMRYTFKVERSKYHKGRLLVQWDPAAAMTTIQSETAIYSVVFDLESEEQEFHIDVPYKASQPWLQCLNVDEQSTASYTSPSRYYNGSVGLFVLNKLTSPILTSTVTVLVMAEALDDMEFSAPRALPTSTTFATVQSGAIDSTIVSYSERIPEITVGERVGSLRTILHRTTRSMTQLLGVANPAPYSSAAGLYHAVNFYDRLPPVYGYTGPTQASPSYQKGTSTVTSPQVRPFNYCTTHPINWVLSAFAGYRGSVNVHASVTAHDATTPVSTLSITRIDHPYWDVSTNNVVRNAYLQVTAPSSASTVSYNSLNATPGPNSAPVKVQGGGGMTVTNAKTFQGISANIPQYSRFRFTPNSGAFPDNAPYYDGFRVDADFESATTLTEASAWPIVDVYYSAGVDFNPVFWTGVPRMYSYLAPTPIYTNGW